MVFEAAPLTTVKRIYKSELTYSESLFYINAKIISSYAPERSTNDQKNIRN
jgi:hypothetical protein